MSDNDSPVDDADEAELRRVLEAEGKRTSAAHDEAVLAAARRMLDERGAADARSAEPPARGRRAVRRARPEQADVRRRRRRLTAAASVAASIVAVVAIVTLIPRAPELPDGLRGDAPAVTPPHDGRLGEPPVEIAWPAQPGATAYVVVLRNASAEVLWTSPPQSESSVTLPADVRESIRSEGTYLWTVEIDGASLLGPYWFHVGER